ncbi:MAG: DUF4743 domain-containing protein [Zetaproteobacteria bacterium CG12_big_fil_rev_8_21_14_0_65_54_13]|nr:MAG: DUF4743 domain-containing protein [Zetaproteobacteria bacterium CG12_big_fil_rev_8_21_14_0_65_54_13]PIX54492.1 MAG: DUF4743 domain-containing protein [Zetaproteobacteria bacterium CG_4_10_14_3_um_filter_54_28]PJA28664.1 MAG: DUF4743 domain-containing protein [Zetaproteobacteria bacterium CG_4_9_14_3_um_filter_54_145]
MNYTRHIEQCNRWNPDNFIPFIVGAVGYGWMRPAFAGELRRFPAVFVVDDRQVALHPALQSFEARNSAVAEVLIELVRLGLLDHLMGELYPVLNDRSESPAFLLDRAAVSVFGVRSFGQHVNGFVESDDGLLMWVGRRAADRHTFPDLLDQMVAGGFPFGITAEENLAKECEEEAGIAPELAAQAVATSVITYRRETEAGLRSDTIYCYDLSLPAAFKPVCTDGEVAGFYLWRIENVARMVAESDAFKPNCNLVVIDFLLRHGLIGPDHHEFKSLSSGLQSL